MKVKSMKKILAFCFFPAFVPTSNGGESRLFNFYKSLSRHHHVTLLTSTHLNTDEEKIYHGSNFIERRIPKDSHFSMTWEELEPYSSGGDLSAVSITVAGKFPTLLHNAYLEEYESADLIIHDFPFTIDYDLFFNVDDKVRIYNAHNCETLLYKALHPEPKSQPIWEIVKDAETKMLSGCDVVLYCNENDLKEFKHLVPNARYLPVFAPNGMSPQVKKVHNKDKQNINSIVFIGSKHPPNVDAAMQIVDNIAPRLPQITFHIIGECLPKGKYPKNIIRHGFVNDTEKEALICQADLAINPMGKGSGSNIKVFDLLSYAIPVLSSEFGMRGISAVHRKNCLIAPTQEFTKTIQFWSTRYEQLQKIGENGRILAVNNYSWDVVSKNISEIIYTTKKKGEKSEKFILALNDYDSYKNSGGGGVRTKGIYSAINNWCPVVFICFSDDNEITVRKENDKTIVFSIPKTKNHIENQQKINSLSHISADDIIAHRECRFNPWLISIYNILKKGCRNIILEHPYLASIPISYNDRFIYSSQNCEVQIKKELMQHHPLYSDLISEVEKIETEAVKQAAAVIAVSKHDADCFARSTQTSGPIIIVPNGASEPAQPNAQELAAAKKSITKEKSAVFVGSAHIPNIDAVKYIIEKLAPTCPEYEFHIIGTVCTAFPTQNTRNIHFWGVLSETMKSAVMQSCSIALNTVITGGGSNIKLADYLANDLYVVTTPFGLRGYPKEINDYLSVAELNDFPKATKEAFLRITNKDFHKEHKCRQFFEKKLSMTNMAEKIVKLLQNLEQPKKKDTCCNLPLYQSDIRWGGTLYRKINCRT
jgi:glycosyltransferase involved in cell wall biosynthesis